MISVIITTKDTPETFKKSFQATLASSIEYVKASKDSVEIIVTSPEIYPFLSTVQHERISIIQLKDPSISKPIALNISIEHASTNDLVLTDGDVLMDNNAISNLITYVYNNHLSVAGGKPVSMNAKETMLGYWSHLLTEAQAHPIRKEIEAKRIAGHPEFFPASGYLFYIKKDIFTPIEQSILADDAYMSFMAWKKGNEIGYCEDAIVMVGYPLTYQDYLRQKVRSVGGYGEEELSTSHTRSFWYEARKGIIHTLSYANTPKELWWSILLLGSRLHVWFLILWKIKLLHKKNIWQVVQSSKKI